MIVLLKTRNSLLDHNNVFDLTISLYIDMSCYAHCCLYFNFYINLNCLYNIYYYLYYKPEDSN